MLKFLWLKREGTKKNRGSPSVDCTTDHGGGKRRAGIQGTIKRASKTTARIRSSKKAPD